MNEDLTTYLDEQQAIADAASEGPWYSDIDAGSVYVRTGTWEDDDGNEKPYEEAIFEDRSAVAYKDGPPNVAFIAASRQAVPRLIEIARTQQAEIEQLRRQVERAMHLMEEMDKFITAYRDAWNEARQITDARWYQVNSDLGRSAISDVLKIQEKLAREHGLPEAGE